MAVDTREGMDITAELAEATTLLETAKVLLLCKLATAQHRYRMLLFITEYYCCTTFYVCTCNHVEEGSQGQAGRFQVSRAFLENVLTFQFRLSRLLKY